MFKSLGVVSLVGLVAASFWLIAEDAKPKGGRDAAQKLLMDGNFKDAYDIFQSLATNSKTEAAAVGNDLTRAVDCLANLGRIDEAEALIEKSVAAQAKNWRLLRAAAQNYQRIEHFGFMIAGKFERGHRRGQGKYVSSFDRDRVRALQLLQQAIDLAKDDPAKVEIGRMCLEFANVLQQGSMFGADAWKLQVLTDLTQLPDYDDAPQWGWRGRGGNEPKGAPVDENGNPVFYQLPKAYADAKSDGERWRWLLLQATEFDAGLKNESDYTWAVFLHSQFGVQTMASFGFTPKGRDDDGDQDDTGPFTVHTLKDNETIAKLATGVKRFELPEGFNPLKLFQELSKRNPDQFSKAAGDQVAQTYEDRRQYPKAAEAWKFALGKFGDENHRQQRLDQIVKNWGRFENAQVQPAGKGATVDFRFRNGSLVAFEAQAIKVADLLADVKTYLKSSPKQVDWQQINIADVGYRLVIDGGQKYLGEKVANWTLDVKPKPQHEDSRVTVTTPLQKAGAYLLTGQMKDGNVSRIILWVADTVIVKKQLDKQSWYYVADAVTGRPVAKANVEYFGWRQEQVKPNENNFRVITKNFAEHSDADGQVILKNDKLEQGYQWLITARGADGRMAYLGFTNVWYGNYYDPEYNATKVFTITDRPVYRPEQTVKFKFWIGQAKYDQGDDSPFAGKEFTVLINTPQGEKVYEQVLKADKFGGLEGEYALPKGAQLGVYSLQVLNLGGSSFRVEEYKKPEFEVTVEAPTEPVQLGEKITAKVQAKYFFGAPVAKGKVKYKILRSSHSSNWYPVGRWDWFYGRGYWWFAADYAWYPGWNNWGCWRPAPWWWGGAQPQPEVVAEQEVDVGADGTIAVEIDTLPAKEIHGDQDHAYTITAEVTDESRRTIVGEGKVLVARKPFKVFAWVDKGHYRVGDDIHAHFQAHTLDQKPVQGKGVLKLYRITYDQDAKPVETEAGEWKIDTNAQGTVEQQIAASKAGQYRLSYTLTDAKDHAIEGGYVFVVIGDGFDGREFRFNDIELITEKREYAPGETVRLMINTNKTDGTVAVFLRPTNGIYLPPKIIRLKGKSTVEEIAVVQKDMPNFFVEAFTIADGKYREDMREVIVPPEKRVINVAVEPSETEYKPGAEAKLVVKLTGLDGKPFVGSTVLSVYDKSVEYISGGSNVPAIKEFFWKWRRNHYPQRECTLDRVFVNLLKQGEIGMNDLGAFGGVILDQLSEQAGMAGPGGFGGGRGGAPMSATRGMYRDGGRKAGLAKRELQSNALAAAPAAAEADRADASAADESGAAGGAVQPSVRSNFADTAYWAASVTTDAAGVASVDFKMPENLTGWKVKAWAMGAGTKVGEGSVEVTTKKNLLVRLQAPRFFVEKDEVVVSANIHNYLKDGKKIQAILELDGGTLSPMDPMEKDVEVAAGGEQRVDWRIKVDKEGQAVVRMKALSDEESDAMEMKFPAYVHGMLKMESFSGALRPKDESGQVTYTVPKERRINDSRLEARFSPTLAGAMVDALPYLVDYPYGCTEQTLNRFLPTVITQKILQDMQLDLKAIQEKRTNLNAQEIGDEAERAKGWKRYDRNPVFDVAEVQTMVKDGLERLTSMQLSDGGWGWFSGYGEHSWPHTTAVVVHGLQIAKQNDVALVPDVLERGITWLTNYQNRQVQLLKNAADKKANKEWKEAADALDAFVYMVLIDADVANNDMLEFLYRDRVKLPVYAKALYGLALVKQKQQEKLDMVLQNIEQFVVQDNENQTAYLKLPENNFWWYWYGSEVEANAYYLKLLSKTNPQDVRASRLVKYLLNNRKHATYWNSTRDTALCIEALADYMKASGEDQPNLTVEVWLDGKKQKEVKVDKTNLFTFDNKFVLIGDAVADGRHTIEFKKSGTGPLYYNVYQTNFTLEDFITKAGLEVKVQRKFYKLTKSDKQIDVSGSKGQAVKQKVEKYVRTELPNLSEVKSGDLVEIELEIDSKNDYEYLVFEDMKAAGFEPVDVRSGYNGNDLGAYVEFRDEKVAFFVRALARGKSSVSYRLRAEIPGKFSALPTRASAMYAPELKGNSDEMKITVVD